MQNIIPAIIKARQEFSKIEKDGINPHFKNKYASLDSVLDAVTPSLSKHGLCIVQSIQDYTLKTFVYHDSGEFLESSYPLPQNLDSQKFGAAITYARRYSLCAILSITADEDDDAQSAFPNPKKSEKLWRSSKLNNSSQNERVKSICSAVNYPTELARDWLKKQGKSSFDSLSISQIDNFIKDICKLWVTQFGASESDAMSIFTERVKLNSEDELQNIIDWMDCVRISELEDSEPFPYKP